MANTLDLTDAEAVLLNTLYSIMVAEANGHTNVIQGSYNLLSALAARMSGDEMLAMNRKMSGIVKKVSREFLDSMGIEGDGYKMDELDRKYGELFDQHPDPNRRQWN